MSELWADSDAESALLVIMRLTLSVPQMGVSLLALWSLIFSSAVRACSKDAPERQDGLPFASMGDLPFPSHGIAPNNEATYLKDCPAGSGSLRRLMWSPIPSRKPDTTIVLLNWTRLRNVILQVSVYCDPLLQDVVEQVFIWNNQPGIKLDYNEHFANTGCAPHKIRIYNSPSNIYFQARFKGCIDSHSRYCFLQDDDYITRPEILRNIHASFYNLDRMTRSPSPIILLPPHDHLETDLLRVSISQCHPGADTRLTSFSCLGHGTFLLRSQATAYLSLLQQLQLSEEEMNIADNYFTLLHGQVPNTWFTHTVELSDVAFLPFTAGMEGDERNWRHIDRAMVYLDRLVNSTEPWPHFALQIKAQSARLQTTPCIVGPCIISSNIATLPHFTTHTWTHGTRMRDIQAARLAQLGREGAWWYINNPLSNAVDGNVETAFKSAGYAKAGDYVSIALSHSQSRHDVTDGRIAMDVVWLVDVDTASVLYATELERSQDGVIWHPMSSSSLTCFSTTILPQAFYSRSPFVMGSLRLPQNAGAVPGPSTSKDVTFWGGRLLECHTSLDIEWTAPIHVRAHLGRDIHTGWSIYEVWMRANHNKLL